MNESGIQILSVFFVQFLAPRRSEDLPIFITSSWLPEPNTIPTRPLLALGPHKKISPHNFIPPGILVRVAMPRDKLCPKTRDLNPRSKDQQTQVQVLNKPILSKFTSPRNYFQNCGNKQRVERSRTRRSLLYT